MITYRYDVAIQNYSITLNMVHGKLKLLRFDYGEKIAKRDLTMSHLFLVFIEM